MQFTTLQQLYIVLFAVFCGATYQFANKDERLILGIGKRLSTALFSFLIVGMFGAYAIVNLNWNVFIIAGIGALISAIADVFLRLWLAYNRESNGLLDFIRRMKRAYTLTTKDDDTPTPPAQ